MSEWAAAAAQGAAALLALRLAGARRAGTALMLLGFVTIAITRYRYRPSDFVLTFSDLLLVAGLLLPSAVRQAWGARRDPHVHEALPLVAAVGLMIAGGLVGTLSSPDVQGSLFNVLRLATASLGLLALVTVWSPTVPQVRLAAALLIASVIISALAGVFGLDYLFGRVRGLTHHPNHLGTLAAIAAGPAIVLALSLRGRPAMLRVAGVAALTLLALTMLIAGLRTGLVASSVVVLLSALLLRPRGLLTRRAAARALAAGAALSLAVMLSGFSEDPVSRLFHDDAQLRPSADAVSRLIRPRREVVTNDDRIDRFGDVMDRIENSPFFGDGFQQFDRPHNVYLQMWAAGGLAGLTGMLAIPLIAVSWLRRAYRALRASEPGSEQRATALLLFGLATGTIGFAVSGLFEPSLWERWVWLTPALAIATLRHLEGQSR